MLIGSYYLFYDSMQLYPSFVHAWTQSDRLAIAQNFQENGFDFFHPATYNLLTKHGITQVDFPIHEYLIACLSKLTNVNIITLFRTYNLLFSLLGLFFLYKTVLLLSQSGKKAVFSTLFVFTLPFYVYYQNGFLPSVTSFSCFLIALYYLAEFSKTRHFKTYYIALFFLSLAALTRLPFVIFLFAFTIERTFSSNDLKIKVVGPPILGLMLFGGYYLYNSYLGKTYGSMFLGEFLYFDSFDSFYQTISTAWDRWSTDLLSPFHFIILLLLLVFYFLNSNKSLNLTLFKSWFSISALGVLCYFFLMGKQFADHDYYYLDTFLPLFILGFLYVVSRVEIPKTFYTPFGVLCLLFVPYFFSFAKEVQNYRYTPAFDDRVHYAYKVYEKASQNLADFGISKEDTLLELDAVSTNMPFTLWGNKGYTLLNSGEDSVRSGLTKKFDYAFMVDSSFRLDSWRDFPNLVYHLDRYAGKDGLSFYTKSKDTNTISFFNHLIYHGQSNFDDYIKLDSSSILWMQTATVDSINGKSYFVPKNYEYFLSSSFKLNRIDSTKPVYAMVNADYYLPEDTAKIQLIVNHGDYYFAHYLESQIQKVKEWQSYTYHNKIPIEKLNSKKNISIYFWNPAKNEMYIDNLNIIIYQ